jgi:hypothetical protein
MKIIISESERDLIFILLHFVYEMELLNKDKLPVYQKLTNKLIKTFKAKDMERKFSFHDYLTIRNKESKDEKSHPAKPADNTDQQSTNQ